MVIRIQNNFFNNYSYFHKSNKINILNNNRYEREAIQKWFLNGNKTSPSTNEILHYFILTPNHLVKKVIVQFLEKHQLSENQLKQL